MGITMSNCIKCGSTKAYWMIRDKENKAEYYCDPCFKKNDLADYKKEMEDYHKRKKEESLSQIKKKKEVKTNLIQDLLNIKIKLSELQKNSGVGHFWSEPGLRQQAQEHIPIICMNIDQAIKALKTGFDPNNNPITKPQIAHGLKNLIKATQTPEFIGLVGTVLNFMQIQMLEKYINELEKISNRISSM
jgi:ribosomal protein S18